MPLKSAKIEGPKPKKFKMAEEEDDLVFLENDATIVNPLTTRRRHYTLPEARGGRRLLMDSIDDDDEEGEDSYDVAGQQPLPPRQLTYHSGTARPSAEKAEDSTKTGSQSERPRGVTQGAGAVGAGSVVSQPHSRLMPIRSAPILSPETGRPRSLRVVQRSISTDTGLSLCSLSSRVQFKVKLRDD